MSAVVLLSAVRTPWGRSLGSLSDVSPLDLGAVAMVEALRRAGQDHSRIEQTWFGNLHATATNGNPAAAAMSRAGFTEPVPALTVRAGCASGLMAIGLACDGILSGSRRCVLAGGFESASSAPHLALGLRKGLRLGGGTLVDTARQDGPAGSPVGREGDTATLVDAARAGSFGAEIHPVEIPGSKGGPSRFVDVDDVVRLSQEKRTERPDGETPPRLADGAAAVVLASETWAASGGLRPMARLTVLWRFDRSALAGVTAVEADVTKETGDRLFSELPPALSGAVNPAGGGADLGHAAGADGARLIVRLVHRLQSAGGGRGLAVASGGWGETAAILVEI